MRDFFPSYASVCSLLAISSASFSLRSLDAVLGERRKFDDLSEGRYLKALGHRRGNEKIPSLVVVSKFNQVLVNYFIRIIH